MVVELFPDGHWRPPSVTIIAIQTTMIFIATVCVALRLYTRFTLAKRIAVDDVCIVLGWSFALARVVVACLSSQSGWASRAGPSAKYQIPYYLWYFERRLFYALSALFIRSSILTYYLRLFPPQLRRLRFGSWILLVLSLAQGIQLISFLARYCNDLGDLYRGDIAKYHNPRCSDTYVFTYSGTIGDSIIDAMIYTLPLPYVWGLRQLRLDQRISLVFVFGMGIFACIFALVQIPFIFKNYRFLPTGQSWFGSEVSLFIGIELAFGLIAANLPDIRGLAARAIPGFLASFRHRYDPPDRQPDGPSSDTHTLSAPEQQRRHADEDQAEGGGVLTDVSGDVF
jgi:hypothetical protein